MDGHDQSAKRTRSARPIVGAFFLLLTACASPPTEDAVEREMFTGEVKPVLYVSDVEAAAPFYEEVLGFEFLGYTDLDGEPYYAEMAAGPLKFGLHEPTDEGQIDRIGQQRLYFRVTDLTRQRARVADAGGEPGEIRETDWMDMFIVHDADGHEIVFAVTDPATHSVDPW
jgi:predicted enzyme related to lactoylglutathione lyase